MLTSTSHREKLIELLKACGLEADCLNSGSILSQIAIIAEAPGETEVRQKSPLVGASGAILWRSLRKIGIDRSQCYVTNVVKRRLLLADDTKVKVQAQEKELWFTVLKNELAQLPNLRYVLCLGNFALEALTGKTGVSSWRGSVLPITIDAYVDSERLVKNVEAVIANNPAMCIREPKTEVYFDFDIFKLKRVIAGEHSPTVHTVHINPTYNDAVAWLRHMRYDVDYVSVDIELLGTETACIGTSGNDHEAMCIAFRNGDGNVYSASEEAEIRREAQGLLLDERVRLIMQNGAFDCGWLGFKDRIRVKPLFIDTMLAHHTLYPALPHNLGFLTTQYTDNPYYKDEKDTWKSVGDVDDFWRYNGKDCCNTYAVAMQEIKELREQKLDEFFFSHIMRVQPYLIGMTLRGLNVDQPLKQKITEELEIDLQSKLKEFYEAVHNATQDLDYYPLPTSPKQLSGLFFNRLKLIGRGVSTDKTNRDAMRKHPRTGPLAKVVLDKLDAFATEQKFFSTYAKSRIDEDGRIRCTWKQTGVESAPGRLSSAQTTWETGMNMQNQTDRSYPMFIAEEGKVFWYFDLSQAEARVVGWLAGIESWIEQFERARIDGQYDCHRALAAEMFGIPYEQVPTKDRDSDGHVTIRYIAKRCRHGLNYRMGPDRLAQVTGLSSIDALHAYELYHRLTPELKRWWAKTIEEYKGTKRLYSPLGRRMLLMERIDERAMDSVVAFRPQSTVGDHVQSVIYSAMSDPEWPRDAWVDLNVHDALIGQASPETAHTALRVAARYAEKPLMINGRPLIIPVECGISLPDDLGVHRISTIQKIKREEWA